MNKRCLVMMVVLLVCGCGRRYLERTGVPIWQGMRVNAPEEWAQLPENLKVWEATEADGVCLELPLRADSLGLPVVGNMPGSEESALLRGKRLSIALATTNLKELFPDELQVTDAAWFAQLEVEIDRLLQELKELAPERLIVGGAWGDYPMNRAGWASCINSLRRKWPRVKISLGGRPELVADNGLAALSDEVAIDYPPMAGEEQRSSCRNTNLKIAELAVASGKAIFIYRANVMGDTPSAQFQNRLRFWREDATLAGMCLNSLYPYSPLRDAKSYYGLADNPDVGEFLKEYKGRTSD